MDRQFYAEELTPVKITKKNKYPVDKILDSRFRRGIREHTRDRPQIQHMNHRFQHQTTRAVEV
jgi:hypothetical protein